MRTIGIQTHRIYVRHNTSGACYYSTASYLLQTVATLKRHILRIFAAFPLGPPQPAPPAQLPPQRLPFQPFNKMAWHSSGATNQALVDNLWRNGLITSPAVKDAFLKVDRAHYAPASPYDDSPQPIGHAATISAPHMHATAVENLLPYLLPTEENPAPRALDVGSGSGYLTHVMAELVGDKGTVVGVEHIEALTRLGEENMGKSERGREFLRSGRVRFGTGDGRLGWKGEGAEAREAEEDTVRRRGEGWDVIHVGASAREVHPELVRQLRAPGRIFIPVDDEEGEEGSLGGLLGLGGQHVWTVDKDENGKVSKKKLFGVRYVPLTDAPK